MWKYAKYALAALGCFLFLVGIADWAAGALVPHGRYLLGIGTILMAPAIPNVVAAGIRYLRQRSAQSIKTNS